MGREEEIVEKKHFKPEMILDYSLPMSLLLLLPVATLFLVFFIYPLVRLFSISFFQSHFTLENYIRFFKEPIYALILLRTIRVSLFVSIICLLVGYPLAYVLSHARGKRLALLMACIILPFWTSILVRNYAWIVLLQRKGVINTILEWMGLINHPLRMLYTEPAVMVGMIHFLLPFMILPIYSVLKRIDPSLIRAAYNLGANPIWAFLKVIFPLSLPGVGAGLSIVFIIGLGFFITPALLGGPKNLMISTLIETQININNWPFASAIALILFFLTVGLILIFNSTMGLNQIFRR